MIKVYLTSINAYSNQEFKIMEQHLPHPVNIKREQAKKTSILSQFLVKTMLDDPQLSKNKYGKPFVVDHSIEFNLSHSNGLVALAVSENEIGIDLQSHGETDHFEFVKNFITPTEWEQIKDNKEKFYQLWTGKEAYLKYLGVGLYQPLDSFEINLDSKHRTTVNDTNLQWFSFELDGPDDKFSLCVCTKEFDRVELIWE